MNTRKNYIYNTAYNLLNVLLPIVTAPYLARILGTEGVGTYSYYYSIAFYFTFFAKIGMSSYGTREIARVRENKTELSKRFWEIYTVQITAVTIVLAIYLLGTVLFSSVGRTYLLIFGIWIFGIYFDVDWLLFGLERFKSTATKNILVKISAVLLILLFVKTKSDVWKYVLIMALSYAVGYFLIWVSLPKYVQFARPSRERIFNSIKPSILLMIPVLAVNIYRSMDKVMLGALDSVYATGIYEYGEKLVYCLTSFISSLGTVTLPKLAALRAKGNENDSQIYMCHSMHLVMAMSSAMAFGLMGIADTVIPVLFGSDFIPSSHVLAMLSVTLIPIGWANIIRNQYVIPMGLDHIYVGSVCIGAVLNLILNFVLIPYIGINGAIISTLIAEFQVPVFQYLMLHRHLPYKRYLKETFMYVLLGIVMAILVRGVSALLGVSIVSLIIQIVAGAGFYLAGVCIYLQKCFPSVYQFFAHRGKES